MGTTNFDLGGIFKPSLAAGPPLPLIDEQAGLD